PEPPRALRRRDAEAGHCLQPGRRLFRRCAGRHGGYSVPPLPGFRAFRHSIGRNNGLDRHGALSQIAFMIIAIDGPAASGKGTLGKRLAHHYGYRQLDTGVIYRAVAWSLLQAGADPGDELLAVAAALELDPEKFGNPILKTQKVGEAASGVSAIPKVREVLLNFQR
ncbi:hypothetical protein KXW87_001265, partial [Aspergillus fumigatus]